MGLLTNWLALIFHILQNQSVNDMMFNRNAITLATSYSKLSNMTSCDPYLGVCTNGGSPKWIVYNGKSIYKWMIWYPDFRKPPFIYWLMVWNMFDFSVQLGMSSSQLTFTPSFFRGVGLNHQPDIKITNHQYWINIPFSWSPHAWLSYFPHGLCFNMFDHICWWISQAFPSNLGP